MLSNSLSDVKKASRLISGVRLCSCVPLKRIVQKGLLVFQIGRAAGDTAIGAQDLRVHTRQGEDAIS